MATISITKGWADGEILLEADLDAIKSGVETFLNTTKINDDNIQTSGITASSKLIDASISTAKLADSCVTTAKINDSGVTTAKINDSAVTTAKIAAANVTKAKLATAARDPTTSSKSADFTADLTVDNYYVTTAGGAVTMTLPAASTADGHEYTVTKTNSGTNTLTIDGNSSETINGATTLVMYEQYETVKIYCNGTEWFVSHRHIPGNTFQPVVVRAKTSSSQGMSADAWTTVVFDSEDVDNKSAHNTSTGRFTVPTGCAGQYMITATVESDDTSDGFIAGDKWQLATYHNASTRRIMGTWLSYTSAGIPSSVTGVDLLDLAAGDTVDIQLYNGGTGTRELCGDNTRNHMSIVRVR